MKGGEKMRIKLEISDIEETVKLIKKINSLTEELEEALMRLQGCSTFGRFELNENEDHT